MASLNSRKHSESLSSVRPDPVPQAVSVLWTLTLGGRLTDFKRDSKSQIKEGAPCFRVLCGRMEGENAKHECWRLRLSDRRSADLRR